MNLRTVFGGLALAAALGSGAARAEPAPPGLKVLSATFACADLDRALAFYTKGLGLRAAGRIEHETVSEIPLLFPGSAVSLLLIKAKGGGAASAVPARGGRVILAVPDLKALEAQLTAAGYALRKPITEQKDFHLLVAVAADPDGNELELIQQGS